MFQPTTAHQKKHLLHEHVKPSSDWRQDWYRICYVLPILHHTTPIYQYPQQMVSGGFSIGNGYQVCWGIQVYFYGMLIFINEDVFHPNIVTHGLTTFATSAKGSFSSAAHGFDGLVDVLVERCKCTTEPVNQKQRQSTGKKSGSIVVAHLTSRPWP